MKDQLAAFIERALPRGFSAMLILLLAVLTNPTVVGTYAYVTLLYTAIQAGTELAARQVLLRVATERRSGAHFWRYYRAIVPPVACLLLLSLIVVLKLLGVVNAWWDALGLIPIAFAPAMTTAGLPAVGSLQVAGKWATIARAQMLGSLAGASIAIPLLVLTRSALGPASQVLVSEALVTLWCVRAARRLDQPRPRSGLGQRSIGADMMSMSAYTLASWLQGQAERVLLGILAGPAVLGTYSTASAIARAPGDALAASTANVVRAEIANLRDPEDVRHRAQHILIKAMLLAGGGFAASLLLSLVLRPIMGSAWSTALGLVPILAISAFPSVLAWSAAVMQLKAGKSWQTLCAPLVGTMMALLIAYAAGRSLILAGFLVVLRDLATVTVAFVFIRRAAPWRAYSLCCACVVVLGVAMWAAFG